MWQRLIELGVFDDFYPQRLHAAFKHLDSSDTDSFTLKDLIQKGNYIFSYLGLDIPRDSTFVLMDIYRIFDKDGNGDVSIEEFVRGMVEKLFSLSSNEALLESIAEDMLGAENRSLELAARLDKDVLWGHSSDKFALFKRHLKAFNNYIRERLRCNQNANLNSQSLVSIFQDSIMQAVRDVHCYFHITFDRLTSGRNITADRSPEQIHPTDSIQYAHVLWHLPSSSSSQSQAGTELGSDFLLSTLRPEHKLSDDAAVVHGPSMSNKDSTMSRRAAAELVETSQRDEPSCVRRPDIDSSQLYVLQTAFRSLENYFALTNSSKDAPAAAAKDTVYQALSKPFAPPSLRNNASYRGTAVSSDDSTSLVLSSGFEFELANHLAEAQESLNKLKMRVNILQMIQEEAALGSTAVDLDDSDQAGDLFVEKDADEQVADLPKDWGSQATSFDGIMSELGALRTCLAERASADYPLGLFLEKKVAVVSLECDEQRSESSAPTDVRGMLQAMRMRANEMQEVMQSKAAVSSVTHSVAALVKQQEEEIASCRMALDQSDLSRNEFIALNVELQILRDKHQRQTKDAGQLKLLQLKNLELSKHVQELEEQLEDFKSRRGKDADGKSDGKKVHELKLRVQQLSNQSDLQIAEIERLQKEIQRLKSAVVVSEQRTRGSLQDQMALHHQLHQLEEENMTAKANIIKISTELHDHKTSRDAREESDRRIIELQRELQKRDMELAESREEANMATKYQMELLSAEKTIESLEIRVSDLLMELEKGAVALLQLDKYREQLRLKNKENRDMSLHIHGLENQLKEVPYLQSRHSELQRELEDSKFKVEQLPGLLSEQARLRGSSRAAVKALMEQDKVLAQLKAKTVQLERENAVLKNDNRSMQDIEVKLKEANQEIKRLMNMVTEVHSLKKGLKTAEDEKKSIEGQQKKMRKFIRQSILVNSATATIT